MNNRRQRMAGRIAAKKATAPPQNNKVEQAAAQLMESAGLKPVPNGKVTYACGHDGPNGKCPKCLKDEKAARNGKQAGPGHKGNRLPDGSNFEVAYSAVTVQWKGRLNVPVEGEAGLGWLTFTDWAPTVFTLLVKLDQQYRKWLKQPQEASA